MSKNSPEKRPERKKIQKKNKSEKAISGDWKSTALAIDIERLFDVAEILYVESAKNNKSQSSFSSMVVLIAAVKGYGYAKIIVGKYRDANAEVPYCQYCVMNVSLRKLKNK